MFLKKKEKRIYLDYAAATPIRKEVSKEMSPYWSKSFGNPGAVHKEGLLAKKTVENTRKKISQIMNCSEKEIIFTSSGTESNNLAVFGIIEKFKENGGEIRDIHLITTVMEHPSILDLFKKYEKAGAEVDYLKIDEDGIVDLEHFRKILKPNTILVSVMYVNNEIGTIQPLFEISQIIKEFRENDYFKKNPVFHTDASQAPLYLDLDVKNLGVDFLTIDGQKIYGPKGVGALYKKENIKISPLFVGGNQEMGYRSGTENVPLIVGLGKALELADKDREEESKRLLEIREYFIEKIFNEIDNAVLNGSKKERLPNNVNISITGIDSGLMLRELDREGIACASKSACIGALAKNSYVIQALGKEGSGSSLRFTMGRQTKKEDIDFTIIALKNSLKK